MAAPNSFGAQGPGAMGFSSSSFSSPPPPLYFVDEPTRDDRKRSWTSVLVVTATLSVAGVSAYYARQLISEYGLQGALNYIWEGDPYPHIRQYLDSLDAINKAMDKEEKTIASLQEALERAQLDSVDGGHSSNAEQQGGMQDSRLLQLWRQNVQKNNNQSGKKNVDLKSLLVDFLINWILWLPKLMLSQQRKMLLSRNGKSNCQRRLFK